VIEFQADRRGHCDKCHNEPLALMIIVGSDGGEWDYCESCFKQMEQNKRRNKLRRERDQAMRDLGLVKVRGNLGGTYWE